MVRKGNLKNELEVRKRADKTGVKNYELE